jgi:hypothetical protein
MIPGSSNSAYPPLPPSPLHKKTKPRTPPAPPSQQANPDMDSITFIASSYAPSDADKASCVPQHLSYLFTYTLLFLLFIDKFLLHEYNILMYCGVVLVWCWCWCGVGVVLVWCGVVAREVVVISHSVVVWVV